MYNIYTIELIEEENTVLARLYLRNTKTKKLESLGVLYQPDNTLTTKEEFQSLFQSIGNTIYGQEEKAKKKVLQEEESYRQTLASLRKEDSTK